MLIPRGGYPDITQALKALALRLQAEGVPLAGLALHPQEDEGALAELREAVPSLGVLSATTPQEALGHLARSRHVVSGRLHGLILAARARRPFSGFAYDPKVTVFYVEAGAQAHPLAPDLNAIIAEISNPHFDEARVVELEGQGAERYRLAGEPSFSQH